MRDYQDQSCPRAGSRADRRASGHVPAAVTVTALSAPHVHTRPTLTVLGLGVRTARIRICFLVDLGVAGQDLTWDSVRLPGRRVTCSLEELRVGGGGAWGRAGGLGRGGVSLPACSTLGRAREEGGTWGTSYTGSPPSSPGCPSSPPPGPPGRRGAPGGGAPRGRGPGCTVTGQV